jgi:hypothetical protein
VTVIIESCFSGQFIDAIKGDCRTIITTSSSTEPSWSSRTGYGGEFSGLYAKYADIGRAGEVNENDDKEVTPDEIYAAAVDDIGRPQTPQIFHDPCICICPSNFVWDCLVSEYDGVVFSAAQWTRDGRPIGSTFYGMVGGVYLPPGSGPVCDVAGMYQEPNDWHWNATVYGAVQVMINVQIINILPGLQVVVPLFGWKGAPGSLPPQPFNLEVNAGGGTYTLLDGSNQLVEAGQWADYPDDLDTNLFEVIDAYRANHQQMTPLELQLDPVSPMYPDPYLLHWDHLPDHRYYVEGKSNLSETTWNVLRGPMTNPAAVLHMDGERGYVRVRGETQ